MKRLVFTFGPCWQFVSFLHGFLLKPAISCRIPYAPLPTINTCYPLLTAACLLLPILIKGQCYDLICNQNVELKLDADCEGSVNPYFIISNNWSCQGPMEMEYFDASGNPLGNIVDGSLIGQTLDVHVTHEWTGLTCWGTVQVVDKRKPTIDIDNVTLNCTEDPGVTSTGTPAVADNCSANITVTHQDSTLDFGCGNTGFAGYFDPANWETCPANNNDGGVDVTGAPDSILVEGASNSPHSSSPKYVTRFKIVIPTEGFVSFDWSSFGGSSFDTEGFYLTINNWCIQLTNDSIQSGNYTTGILHPGDILSFEQMSEGDADAVNTIISNFHFHTLAWKVINRTWSATDEYGNTRVHTQVITLNRASLSQVVFPPDRDGVTAPMLPCGAMADLSQTGEPLVDEDGDLSTTNDQYPVQNGDCTFNLTHQDQVIATCEGSELVLRKWTVIDDCSGQLLEHTQIIKLFDITPPTITCPPTQTLSTDQDGCFGTITLPSATAADDCASTVDIEPTWVFGTGHGPFSGIAPDTYTVTYNATDACGNVASCQTLVIIEDEIEPTVVCDGQTVASLDGDGQAMVYADVVDDGSYDWCCIESFMIKREGHPDTEYAPTLPLSCDDLGTPVMVTLKVTDCSGNFNTCNVDVIVNDNHDPVILPPADVTADCTTDLNDLSQFGVATAFDNCDYTLTYSEEETFTGCGEGNILRTWTASDPSGNSTTAIQTIHLANLQPWNLDGNQIVWPADYSTSGCNLSLEPFDLPPPHDGPILFGQNGCEAVAVSHTDEYFWAAEPSCYQIFRTWTIIDWCQYVPNSTNDGLWEHTQIIEVNDFEPPQFVDPPITLNFQGSSANCAADINLPIPEVDDCSNHITILASGDLGNGFSFSNVPVGTYQMTYTAYDGCGNNTQHTINVAVGDDQPPAAYCINGLTVNLNSNGEVSVNAATFNQGSTDNCSSNLQFSFSPDPSDAITSYNCDDIGQNNITLYVLDEGLNYSTCQTFLMIQDNSNACLIPGLSISGLIQSPQNQLVAAASVELSGMNMPPFTTSQSGSFSFSDLPPGNNYVVTPTKVASFLNGVTAYDLVKINDHILGVDEFDEPWKYIAGDVNSSSSITIADVVAVQNLILFNTNVFPNGTPSWQFVPAGHVFPNPGHPWPFPSSMVMNNLTEDYPDAHFTGIKTGDVTGNADPLNLTMPTGETVLEGETSMRSEADFTIKTTDRLLKAGEEAIVEFTAAEAIAWQFTLNFDTEALAFQEIDGGQANFGLTKLDEGAITAVWTGKAATDFRLKFKVLKSVKLSQTMEISSNLTPAAAWNTEEKLMDVRLEFTEGLQVPPSVFTASNAPNPFSLQTSILFNMPEAGQATFRFYNTAGNVLKTRTDYFNEGSNRLAITKEELNTTGVIYYRIETTTGTATGKMITFD